jgi:hypothetical protein
MAEIAGPLGGVHVESIDLGFSTQLVGGESRYISFKLNDAVNKFLPTCMKAEISNIKVFCPTTAYISPMPDSWGQPTDKTLAGTVGLCPAPVATSVYTPNVNVTLPAYLSGQMKPSVLVGEPVGLLIWVEKATTVQVTFTFHRHGIMPAKPW